MPAVPQRFCTAATAPVVLVRPLNSIVRPQVEFLGILQKKIDSAEVKGAIKEFSLKDTYDDPPFRRYVGSRKNGIDLLFEDERVISIQFFVQPTGRYSGFRGELPFGIGGKMSREDVASHLGSPNFEDIYTSRYELKNAKLSIDFDRHSRITTIFLEPADDVA
jgi:hypothetical protein